jgi:hypothetical protein
MNIKIDSNLGNTYELDLINIYGEVIYSSLVSDNYLKINAKNISSGIYVICLKSNSNVVFLKKIIKH